VGDDDSLGLTGEKLFHLVCQSALDLQSNKFWNSSSAILNEIALQIGSLFEILS
jgi:hypothetical protein